LEIYLHIKPWLVPLTILQVRQTVYKFTS
jgi:hypothetical protein